MRRLIFIAPVLVFVGLVVYFATPLLRGTDPSLIPSPLIDKPIPAFSLAAHLARVSAREWPWPR